MNPCPKCGGFVGKVKLPGGEEEIKCGICGFRPAEPSKKGDPEMGKGVCNVKGCEEDKAEDSEYCPKHRDKKREANRVQAEKRKKAEGGGRTKRGRKKRAPRPEKHNGDLIELIDQEIRMHREKIDALEKAREVLGE